MQNKTVVENVDLKAVASDPPPTYTVEATDIAVTDNLVIELSAADPAQSKLLGQLVLAGIEIVRSK